MSPERQRFGGASPRLPSKRAPCRPASTPALVPGCSRSATSQSHSERDERRFRSVRTRRRSTRFINECPAIARPVGERLRVVVVHKSSTGRSPGEGGPSLPDSRHAVRVEYLIVADHGEIFDLRLRGEHPVKRISMRPGKPAGSLRKTRASRGHVRASRRSGGVGPLLWQPRAWRPACVRGRSRLPRPRLPAGPGATTGFWRRESNVLFARRYFS